MRRGKKMWDKVVKHINHAAGGTPLPKNLLSQTTMVYLTQWLKTATRGNVKFGYSVHGSDGATFHVFKCEKCKDNLHLAHHLFTETGVPSELQDWVKAHRHVCDSFYSATAIPILCYNCGWLESEHLNPLQSIAGFEPSLYEQMIKNVHQINLMKADAEAYVAAAAAAAVEPSPPKELAVVEMPTGRKFRT